MGMTSQTNPIYTTQSPTGVNPPTLTLTEEANGQYTGIDIGTYEKHGIYFHFVNRHALSIWKLRGSLY